LLDTNYQVETPEAIDLTAHLAGPVTRILAYIIDLSIRTGALLVLFIVLAIVGKAGMGVFLIAFFLLEWLYPVGFETLGGGQTPGKRYLHIMVVNDDLTPVTWSTSLIRNLLRSADILPFGYTFGLLVMCSSKNFQRLGDLAAGSIVIHKRAPGRSSNHLPNVVAVPPPVPLSLDDQVAFTGFLQRQDQLSEGRKRELAEILQALTDKKGEEAVTVVQGIGSWLLGNR